MGLSVQWTVWEDRKVLELGGAAGSALVHVTELCLYNGAEGYVACIHLTTFNDITQTCLFAPSKWSLHYCPPRGATLPYAPSALRVYHWSLVVSGQPCV